MNSVRVTPNSSLVPPSQQLSESQSCSWVWVELVSQGELSLLFLVPLPEPLVFCSDDTPHVPNERLSEAAVLQIVKQLTQLIREAFPGKIVPWVPPMFPVPRQCLAQREENSTKVQRNDLPPRR